MRRLRVAQASLPTEAQTDAIGQVLQIRSKGPAATKEIPAYSASTEFHTPGTRTPSDAQTRMRLEGGMVRIRLHTQSGARKAMQKSASIATSSG